MEEPNAPDSFEKRVDLTHFSKQVNELREALGRVLVGQHQAVDLIMVAILARGHVLLEGVPGIAKTLAVKLLAAALDVKFKRIQFTPDLMPSDVLGTSVFNMKTSEFEFQAGPVFANLVLVDEINRAPAKTQAALFEVMEEAQVTVDGRQYTMAQPYTVLATQNPIEQEGTYRLPEAQLDRFLFKIKMDYPSLEEEITILERQSQRSGPPEKGQKAVINAQQLLKLRERMPEIRVEKPLMRYIAQLVEATRHNPSLYLGASPRASLALMEGSRAWAAMQGRDFVSPEDVQFLVHPVLEHRLILTPEREMEGISTAEVIDQIVRNVEVPR